MRLKNKIALLTASAQGIGLATAKRFVEEGAHVIATDINQEKLAALAKQTGCETRLLNVQDAEAIHQLSVELEAALGAVDILFNCAGYVHSGTILDCDDDAWQLSLGLNVTSMHRMIRAFLPAMIKNGGGSIINMSSVASSILGVPNRYAYGATKAAIIGLTKAVASDFVKDGIRCNVICPGTVQTPSLDERLRATGDYEAAKAAFIARQPMGRIGNPEEIAELAVYLGSDASGFTTGACHIIDGGWSL